MSKILSYNNKTTGEDWISLNSQYTADEIEMISDPNGGLSDTPRTAIPSPFAQMDLVKNAFHRLSLNKNLRGERMDEKLVSDALDIAQLFFNYNELGKRFSIVEWNKVTHIEMLKSSQQHRLLGETLEMFLLQDKEAFNFDLMDKLFFLVYDNQVIGSTSPVTLFMATPNSGKDAYSIPIEQNIMLFNQWRQLYQRESYFIKYIYALFTAFPDLKKWCQEFNNYIIRNFSFISSDLRSEILSEIGNPEAYDPTNTNKALQYLKTFYDKLDKGVSTLGIPLFCAREKSRVEDISKSDFIIVPTIKNNELLPLILQNHLNPTKLDPFKYVVNNWDDSIVIKPDDYAMPPEERILPKTTHKYPWLTDDDFLQPAIIKLDYTANQECFFCGNVLSDSTVDKHDFLLPLKPIFFKYFNVNDLLTSVGGKPMFELKHFKIGQIECVTAILRIPIKKTGRYITLTRKYVDGNNGNLSYDINNNIGYFITVPFAISIFPFIRTESIRQYNIMVVDRALGILENHKIGLKFYKNGYHNQIPNDKILKRNRSLKSEKRVGSDYYRITDQFDYIMVTLNGDSPRNSTEGILCPKWPTHSVGYETHTFAIDFGTTNTHIEFMRGNSMPIPLEIDSVSKEKFVATLYNGVSILYDVVMKQEFLPKSIDDVYGFPQRTILSESEHMNASAVDEIGTLSDANIPFIYEKESIGYGNRIIPNLKWSTDVANNKRVKAYITELALLMRTKVLLENGDVGKIRLVWFYPLSMKVGKINKMEEMWKKTFVEVFGMLPDKKNIIKMPESVAPYYYYKCLGKFHGTTSSAASIDIGGGTTDVAIFEPNATHPMMLTSFRFAANVLFGDGFSEIPRADSNPMVMNYYDYFKNLFNSDDDKYGELNGILDDIMNKRCSEDVNAFLFSVGQNSITKDNDVFSYNIRLNEDAIRKLIFIYFYTAIVYYVAKTMQHRGVSKPRNIMFSGTGSKILDIIGTQSDIDILTQIIFECVYNEKYDSDGFSVIIERNEPKQITCRGALMQVRDTIGYENVEELNELMNDLNKPLKYNYSMIDKDSLAYQDMENDSIRKQVINAVVDYNEFFISLCERIHVVDRFLVDYKALQLFNKLVNMDIEHHLAKGWVFLNKEQEEKSLADPIEDSVFFYPIIGIIRENLIENLK